MTLNLANVERLRVAIHETPDEMFDYRTCGSPCGCVISVFHRDLHARPYEMCPVLGITIEEEHFLVGCGSNLGGKSYLNMSKLEATGANGKREAVRRLSVILQRRYGSWRVPA